MTIHFILFYFLSLRKWPTVPQVYIKGEFIGGCDIMLNMHQSGELEDLLVREGLISASGEEVRPETSS